MKKLPFVLMMVFAVAACGGKKDKAADNGSGSTMAGSSMAGSGSAMAGSGSAMAGSDMAGSGSAMAGSAGSGSAMAGSDGSAAMAGSGGSGAAMAGSGAGSAAMASDFDFDKLTHEEQSDFMKKHVMVTMKPLFQKFDAKHYANFTCKTCHGKDPQKSHFKMPTPDLPKLDFEALKAGKQKPEIAKWMGEVVEPEMAKLLNRPQYDPKAPDPKQFGCLGCHEQKK
ncbi:MAG: hypothetical protein QM831_31190 [Kofleriaceae bacterium]